MATQEQQRRREVRLRKIYDRSEGRCHLCRKKLAFCNYGKAGRRGAWEIEHSRPRARGGSDHLNNLYAAHILCNQAKGAGSTSAARRKHGFRAAPPSATARTRQGWQAAAVGGAAALLVPPHIRLPAMLVLGAAGYLLGHGSDPE